MDKHVHHPLGRNSPITLRIIHQEKVEKGLERVPLQNITKRPEYRRPSPRGSYHRRTSVYLTGTPGSLGGRTNPRGIYRRHRRESTPGGREIGEASHGCLRGSFKVLL
jgi:hypothetical protein